MLGRLERGKTLSEKAYEILLEQIRCMEPGSNKLLSEEDIAKNFGISRATVREALKYLMMEGLVTKVQGKGIFAHPSALAAENRVDLRSDFFCMLKNSYGDVQLDIEYLGIQPPSENCLAYIQPSGNVFAMKWTYTALGIKRIHGQFEFPEEHIKILPEKGFSVQGLPEFGRKYLYAPVAYCRMYIKCGFSSQAAAVFGVSPNLPLQNWQEVIVNIDDFTVGFCSFYMHPTEMQMSVITNFKVSM